MQAYVDLLIYIYENQKRQRFLSDSNDFPKRASYPFVDVPAVFKESEIDERGGPKVLLNCVTEIGSKLGRPRKVVILHPRDSIVKVKNRQIIH